MASSIAQKRRPGSKAGKRRGRRQDIGLALLLFFSVILGLFLFRMVRDNLGYEPKEVDVGVTFSKKYAADFGMDWKEAYLAVLDDLQVRHLRIPVYWDEIEPEPGVFVFDDIDWQLEEAASRGARIILAIGRKVPRWPECHAPVWSEGMDEALIQSRILLMLEEVVGRYSDNLSIVAWQVENEPLFRFGECPSPDRDFLKREVAVVSALDERPIMITESGELSTWISAASIADILGVSTYRAVWNRHVGLFYWPVTPAYYSRRGSAISSFVDRLIISELQAEPWAPGPTEDFGIDDQLHYMSPERMLENYEFARRIGFSEVYLWGVEWWYWLKTEGRPEMWDAGRLIFNQPAPTR